MSQVFSADAVVTTAPTTINTTTETVGLTGHFLSPPFQNAKAIVTAAINITVGTGTTSLILRIYRNINAEAVQVVNLGSITVTTPSVVNQFLLGVDAIPDGRAVQYSVSVTQIGATGNGTINYASIAATLISG